MKIHLDNQEQEVRIELLPLIDVIFCILTFFILAAMTFTRQTAINLDLPQAGSGTAQMRDMMIVSVDPVGQIYIDKQPTTQDDLYKALQDYVSANPQGMVVLNASRLASYNDVVQVLDLLKSVGGDRVALATLPNSEAGAGAPAQPGIDPQTGLQAPLPDGTQLPLPNTTTPGLEGGQTNPFDPFSSPNTNNNPFNPNQPLFPTEPSPVAPGAGSISPKPSTQP